MNPGQSSELPVHCTRPNCHNPNHAIASDSLEDPALRSKTCPVCGMPLVLEKRYLPLELLGAGGFGRTFLVIDLNFTSRPRRVLKQLCPATPQGKPLTERQIAEVTNAFKKEATVLNQLKHANIPTIIDFFDIQPPSDLQKKQQPSREDKIFYLVQEYIDGQDLEKSIELHQPFSEDQIRDFLLQMLDILHYIHDNSVENHSVIHRDIKPSNILRDRQGKYWLIDFGAVQQVVQGIPADQSVVVGTPPYASPEQKSGEQITPTSDLYSLAATAVCLLTGKKPGNGLRERNVWHWRSQLPADTTLSKQLIGVLDRLLEVKPGERYQSAMAVRIDIDKGTGKDTSKDEGGRKDSRKWIWMLAGGLAIAAIAVGIKTWRSPSPEMINRSSWGDRILSKDKTSAKQKGIEYFSQGKYEQAIQQFYLSLKENPNDPEAMIFLNNAEAMSRQPFKIAVSVPMGSNPDVAKEILRGVAQAQSQANRMGELPGHALQVEIINDDNDPAIAEQVANQLVDDQSILAVIGHNASDASLAATPIYNKGKLLMITPTSFAIEITGSDPGKRYTLRGTTEPNLMANQIAQYISKTVKKNRIAVCFDQKSQDNRWFKDAFIGSFKANQGTILEMDCNFNKPNFDAELAVEKAIEQGADGLFLAPHINRVQPAIDVLIANHKQKTPLPVFSSPTLYLNQVLLGAGDAAQGLVFSAPWHQDTNASSRNFAASARKLWGGNVNWRTATSYNVTLAIIGGLKVADSREELVDAIRDPSFIVTDGSIQTIQFGDGGSMRGNPVLVQVKENASGNEYFDQLKDD